MFNSYSDDDPGEVDYNIEIKIAIVGESGVGKSNLINRYNGGQFNPNSMPNDGSFFMSKNLQFGEKIYRINIWDTAGQEKYNALTKIFLNEAKIVFLVYAIDNKSSFDKIDFWYKMVKESCGDILIALIGNKKDLYEEEQINEEVAIEKAKKLNVEFALTSAMEEETGFDEIINKMIKKYIQNIGESIETNQIFTQKVRNSFTLNEGKKNKEKHKEKKFKFC